LQDRTPNELIRSTSRHDRHHISAKTRLPMNSHARKPERKRVSGRSVVDNMSAQPRTPLFYLSPRCSSSPTRAARRSHDRVSRHPVVLHEDRPLLSSRLPRCRGLGERGGGGGDRRHGKTVHQLFLEMPNLLTSCSSPSPPLLALGFLAMAS